MMRPAAVAAIRTDGRFPRRLHDSMRAVLLYAGALLLAVPGVAGERIEVAAFSRGELAGWQPRLFSGETRYALQRVDGREVLHAHSQGAASGLYREITVDLARTPVLHWSWKIARPLSGNDETTRAGDDYPARLYVVFSGGAAFWRTRAVNYVWSGSQPAGSAWHNAYTGNARMLALQSGEARAGQWVEERRDVLADYRRLFGAEPGRVAAVAIMTDTDDTGGEAEAWYGDIWFAAH